MKVWDENEGLRAVIGRAFPGQHWKTEWVRVFENNKAKSLVGKLQGK